jgi:hypothetical protein
MRSRSSLIAETSTGFQKRSMARSVWPWPATMEGAVRSGYNAAEALTQATGDPKQFRVPDLAATGLMRLFSQ